MQHRSGNDLPQAEQFYFATTKIGIGRVIVAATIFRRRAVLLCDDENWNRTRHRSGNDLLQAELFYFATTKIGIGRDIVAATTFCRRAILLAGTMVLQCFLISGPDLRIDAAKRSKQEQSLH